MSELLRSERYRPPEPRLVANYNTAHVKTIGWWMFVTLVGVIGTALLMMNQSNAYWRFEGQFVLVGYAVFVSAAIVGVYCTVIAHKAFVDGYDLIEPATETRFYQNAQWKREVHLVRQVGSKTLRSKYKKPDADWNDLAMALYRNGFSFTRAVLQQAGIFNSLTRNYNEIVGEFERMGFVEDNRLTRAGFDALKRYSPTLQDEMWFDG